MAYYSEVLKQAAVVKVAASSGRMPFDIIHRIAQEARRITKSTKKQASADLANACPILLPLLDELRTFCYEHKIEEIPALLAVG